MSTKPTTYVECGCCGHWHRMEYHGDCRNDNERFTTDQVEDFEVEGAILVSLEELDETE